MLELIIYFLVLAPFLMNEKEKEIMVKIIVIAAIVIGFISLFYE